MHGETVTLTQYRYSPRGYRKMWEAEWIGNDANRTTGSLQIWGEHMRLLRDTMGYWTPGENPEWQPFPQQIEAVLEVTPRGLRMASCMGIIQGAAV